MVNKPKKQGGGSSLKAAASKSGGPGSAANSKASLASTAKPGDATAAAPPKKPAQTTAAAAPAPVKAAGAWGSKPLDAVRKAPPPSFAAAAAARPAPTKQPRQQSNGGSSGKWNRNNNKNQRQKSGGGRHGGHHRDRDHHHHGHGGSGGGHHHHNKHHHRGNQHQHHHNDQQGSGSWSRGSNKVVVVGDLCVPGEGSTETQKNVKRIIAQGFLDARLRYLDAPEGWTCPEACHWTHEERQDVILALASAGRTGGEVSQERRRSKKAPPVETAPPLEECKPLEVNEETRWKAKVMNKDGTPEENEDSDEEVLKKALLILNKLSLTKFDKLSDDFINTGIGRNKDCLEGAVGLIVTKAQHEPHFSEMYAQLCFKLASTEFHLEGMDESKSKKAFKKLLLTSCQSEFEEDQAHKIARATEGITDKEEQEYHANIVKKNYLGHMRFIGELYKGDMIKIEIMLWCLKTLLVGDQNDDSNKVEGEVDEEKVECFAKLMTTIGWDLEQQAIALNNVKKSNSLKELNECWDTVEIMAGKREQQEGAAELVVSNRVKFMLQDLIEMRDKGWVTRRKQETAKTIQEIHQEAAKEERKAARRSSSSGSMRGSLGPRRASSGDVRLLDRRDSKSKVVVDQDGFTQISSRNSFSRSGSTPALNRSTSDVTASRSFRQANKPKRGSSIGNLERQSSMDSKESVPKASKQPTEKKEAAPPSPKKTEYPSAEECGNKAKSVLKEYFVSGDIDDAVLSFDEMVGAGKEEGSIQRGGKVMEGSVLLVLEMKDVEVTKAITVLTRCIEEGKLEKESIVLGLNDPLDFLSDIIVDAPLAGSHMAKIVAELVKKDLLSFDFLLTAPEYFLSDGNPAGFGAKVLKQLENVSDAQVEVVEKLMSDEDKETHASARDMIAAA